MAITLFDGVLKKRIIRYLFIMFYILLAKIVIITQNTKQKRQNFYIF